MTEKKETKKTATKVVEKVATPQPQVVALPKPVPLMPSSMKDIMDMGVALAKSKMFPNITTPEAAVAVIEYGRELNIPPVVACQTIYLVKGRLGMIAQLMQALLERDGVVITVLKKDRERCELKFEKAGKKPFVETFTAGDATRMNLAHKDNYKATPEEMYYCRCLTKGGRVYHPSSWLGLYSALELQDDYIEDVTPETEEETKEAEVVTPRSGPALPASPEPEANDTPTPSEIERTHTEEPKDTPPPIAERPRIEKTQIEETKVEEAKVEEETEEDLGGEGVVAPTSEQLAKLSELLATLVDTYGRSEKELKQKMAKHLKKKFETEIKPENIPVELDQTECVNLIGCLEASVSLAEEHIEKAREEEKPKEEEAL